MIADKLFVLSQYLTPQKTLSRLAGALADLDRAPALRKRVIRWFIGRYGVNMSEAAEPDPTAYNSFNAFFTRALKPGTRPVDQNQYVLTSPVDGTISQLGTISDGRIFQAKGQSFSLDELLGGDSQRSAPFEGGVFATLYLAPRDYHRIHMPLAGRLTEMVHVPGKLFSVNPVTAAHVPDLFARNERVVTLFDTDYGPLAMVHVGAMIVGSVETTWAGVIGPGDGSVTTTRYDSGEHPASFAKGDEMGRFRLGSTVILIMPRGAAQWLEERQPQTRLRMGEPLAELTHTE